MTDRDRDSWSSAPAAPDLSENLLGLLRAWTEPIHLLVLSSSWCGDCIRQVPYLARVADASEWIDLRLLDRDEHPEVREELRIVGTQRVPIAVGLSNDFHELGRFGERPLSVYRRWVAKKHGVPFKEGDLPKQGESRERELTEWFEWVERMQRMLMTSPLYTR